MWERGREQNIKKGMEDWKLSKKGWENIRTEKAKDGKGEKYNERDENRMKEGWGERES